MLDTAGPEVQMANSLDREGTGISQILAWAVLVAPLTQESGERDLTQPELDRAQSCLQ